MGFCEHSDEPTSFIKAGNVLTNWMTQLLKNILYHEFINYAQYSTLFPCFETSVAKKTILVEWTVVQVGQNSLHFLMQGTGTTCCSL
jgi:hypothetical protein